MIVSLTLTHSHTSTHSLTLTHTHSHTHTAYVIENAANSLIHDSFTHTHWLARSHSLIHTHSHTHTARVIDNAANLFIHVSLCLHICVCVCIHWQCIATFLIYVCVYTHWRNAAYVIENAALTLLHPKNPQIETLFCCTNSNSIKISIWICTARCQKIRVCENAAYVIENVANSFIHVSLCIHTQHTPL